MLVLLQYLLVRYHRHVLLISTFYWSRAQCTSVWTGPRNFFTGLGPPGTCYSNGRKWLRNRNDSSKIVMVGGSGVALNDRFYCTESMISTQWTSQNSRTFYRTFPEPKMPFSRSILARFCNMCGLSNIYGAIISQGHHFLRTCDHFPGLGAIFLNS